MQYSNNTIGLGALEIIRILLVNQGMQSSFYKYRLWKLHLCKLFFRVFDAPNGCMQCRYQVPIDWKSLMKFLKIGKESLMNCMHFLLINNVYKGLVGMLCTSTTSINLIKDLLLPWSCFNAKTLLEILTQLPKKIKIKLWFS